MNFKLIAITVILLNLAWEAFLEYLNRRSLNNAIPECVKDVYDEKAYQKWRAYKRAKDSQHVKEQILSYAMNLLLVLFDVYAAFAKLFPEGIYWQIFSIILLTVIVSEIFSLPFSIYDTFVIEEKFGFNKSTPKTFVLDEIKNMILAMILMGGLNCLFAALHQWLGSTVVLIFAIAMFLFGLVMSLLTPLLTRIFNKFTPLEDGELKEKLTGLLTAHGYKVRAVEVMDASRRSTKMNAYFTGLGPAKTIVLYDTLVEAATPDQLCAVFAHEMGHGLNHDMMKSRIEGIVRSILLAACIWVLVSFPQIYTDFGFSGINYGFAFVLVGWGFGILEPLLGFISARRSCKAEYRADLQAVKEGYGVHLVTGLKMLARSNFADLSPDPLLVKLTYDHPSTVQRIMAIEKAMKDMDKA